MPEILRKHIEILAQNTPEAIKAKEWQDFANFIQESINKKNLSYKASIENNTLVIKDLSGNLIYQMVQSDKDSSQKLFELLQIKL